jgi:MYXO-CTERM domain-containing protein
MLLLALLASPLAGEHWYQIDSFQDGDNANFLGGSFVQGECWGQIYVPDSGDYPVNPIALEVLFGGANLSDQTMVVEIYEATANGGFGTRVAEEAFVMTGTNEAMNLLIFEEAEMVIPTYTSGAIGVGICFEAHSGHPGPAVDVNGTSDNKHNLLYTGGTSWMNSSAFGVTGDWIMRLCVEGENVSGGTCVDGGGSGDADTDSDADTDTDTDSDADSDSDAVSLISITPNAGAEGEAVSVVLLGSGFATDAEARIGGIPLVGQQIVSDTTISGLAPTSLPSGTHIVEVINGDGSSSYLVDGYTVGGCGCATTGTLKGMGWAALAGLLMLGRRRRLQV